MFKLNDDFRLIKEPHPIQKKLENLYSWKSFYRDKCNTGEKYPGGQDVIQSRKNYFYDWMYYQGGNAPQFSSFNRGTHERVSTSKDKWDLQQIFKIDVEIERIKSKFTKKYEK